MVHDGREIKILVVAPPAVPDWLEVEVDDGAETTICTSGLSGSVESIRLRGLKNPQRHGD